MTKELYIEPKSGNYVFLEIMLNIIHIVKLTKKWLHAHLKGLFIYF